MSSNLTKYEIIGRKYIEGQLSRCSFSPYMHVSQQHRRSVVSVSGFVCNDYGAVGFAGGFVSFFYTLYFSRLSFSSMFMSRREFGGFSCWFVCNGSGAVGFTCGFVCKLLPMMVIGLGSVWPRVFPMMVTSPWIRVTYGFMTLC